jgi:hypothetical protein
MPPRALAISAPMPLCVAVSAPCGLLLPRVAVPCVLSVALSIFMSAAHLRCDTAISRRLGHIRPGAPACVVFRSPVAAPFNCLVPPRGTTLRCPVTWRATFVPYGTHVLLSLTAPPRGTTLQCPVTWRATYFFFSLIPPRGTTLQCPVTWRDTYFGSSLLPVEVTVPRHQLRH